MLCALFIQRGFEFRSSFYVFHSMIHTRKIQADVKKKMKKKTVRYLWDKQKWECEEGWRSVEKFLTVKFINLKSIRKLYQVRHWLESNTQTTTTCKNVSVCLSKSGTRNTYSRIKLNEWRTGWQSDWKSGYWEERHKSKREKKMLKNV